MTELKIEQIRRDGGTQPRALLDEGKIEEYAELMLDGTLFPDIEVVYDGTNYWLVDGFHRVNAAVKARKTTINSEVLQGTLDDALWLSCGVNATHGVPRNNADKKRAVELALRHQKGRNLTDVQLAKHCGVSSMTVGRYRGSIVNNVNGNAVRTAVRDGKKYKMDTENIGRKKREGVTEAKGQEQESEPIPEAPAPVASAKMGLRTTPPTWSEVWETLTPFYRTQLKAPQVITKAAEGVYLATLKLCGYEGTK